MLENIVPGTDGSGSHEAKLAKNWKGNLDRIKELVELEMVGVTTTSAPATTVDRATYV